LAGDDLYGGTYRMFMKIFANYGIKFHFVDMTDVKNVSAHINSNTKLMWTETPSNPMMKIIDIAACSEIAKKNKLIHVVDNTFASPYLQNPLNLGADIVMHSATKYLGGHSDLIAGLVVTKEKELGERIRFIQNASGAILSPFDSWLVIRGIETLPLRIKQHSANAQAVAEFLQSHPEVDKVYYPGLPTHENHEVAKRQSKGFGGIISFTLKEDTESAANDFVTNTRLFKLAESLGGVKSLLCHPAQMTHKSIPVEKRKAAGVADSLIRLSVGLEEKEDLIKDLEQAFSKIHEPNRQKPGVELPVINA
jgi:cystathionine beta-lyase